MTHRLSIAASHDDSLSDLAAMFCKDQQPDAQILSMQLDLDAATVSLWRTDDWMTSTCLFEQPLAHPCVTCSLKEAVVDWLRKNLDEDGKTLLILPANAELELVVPFLSQPEVLDPALIQITETLYFVAPDQLYEEVWNPDPSRADDGPKQDLGTREAGGNFSEDQSKETHVPDVAEDDESDSSEVAFSMLSNLMYADHVLVVEPVPSAPAGSKLVSFLKRPSSIVGSLNHFDFSCIFGSEHQYMLALDYLDPLSVADERNLEIEFDEVSELWRAKVPTPGFIHPDRLLPMLRKLCDHRIVARGYFHMPTRPETGVWQIAGGGFVLGLAEDTGLVGSTLDATGQGLASLKEFQELFRAALVDPKIDLPVDDPQWILHDDCFTSL